MVRHVEERFQPLCSRLARDVLFPPQIKLIHTDFRSMMKRFYREKDERR